jgi:hypothetical protein
MLCIVFEDEKLLKALPSKVPAFSLADTEARGRSGHSRLDLLTKSLSDSGNDIEDLDRFLKEIVASAS